MAQENWTAKRKKEWVDAQRRNITNPIAKLRFERYLAENNILEEIEQQFIDEGIAKEEKEARKKQAEEARKDAKAARKEMIKERKEAEAKKRADEEAAITKRKTAEDKALKDNPWKSFEQIYNEELAKARTDLSSSRAKLLDSKKITSIDTNINPKTNETNYLVEGKVVSKEKYDDVKYRNELIQEENRAKRRQYEAARDRSDKAMRTEDFSTADPESFKQKILRTAVKKYADLVRKRALAPSLEEEDAREGNLRRRMENSFKPRVIAEHGSVPSRGKMIIKRNTGIERLWNTDPDILAWKRQLGNPNLHYTDTQGKYDYIGAIKAGFRPTKDSQGNYHWPSQFKHDDSPERYKVVNGQRIDTKTGVKAAGRQY